MPYIFHCLHCGAEFQASHDNQKFCPVKCEVSPLVPMTSRQLMLMSDDERTAYWNRVYAMYVRADEAAHQLEFQADHDTARRNDWVDA